MPFILEELEVYLLSEKLSDEIWKLVAEWEPFAKFGFGKQMTNAVDSISANIAEGYGQYFIKENINFCCYARGSLTETKSWLTKAMNRQLIERNKCLYLLQQSEMIHKKLNGYINELRENIRKQ